MDLAEDLSFHGVFAPLADARRFAEVFVSPEIGTICWPNGADLDPDVVYSKVSGKPVVVLPR